MTHRQIDTFSEPKTQEMIDFEDLGRKVDENLKEYKEFAFKSRIIDMAIAFILGTSFGKAVSSLSDNVLMPFLTWVLNFTTNNGTSWRELAWTPTHGLTFEMGKFFGTTVDFLVISICLFIIWKIAHGGSPYVDPSAPPPPSTGSSGVSGYSGTSGYSGDSGTSGHHRRHK